jgi:hypothetical protein
VAFVVYVDGNATWTSAAFEQAEQLAFPHIEDGRCVLIEGDEAVGPARRWIFSAPDDKWIEESSPDHGVPSQRTRDAAI